MIYIPIIDISPIYNYDPIEKQQRIAKFLKYQDQRPEGSPHLLQAVQKEEARLLLRLRTGESRENN